jgi:hypothetical protein
MKGGSMLREFTCAWGSLFQDALVVIPQEHKAELMSRAYKLMQAGEYLAGKEDERKVNELCKP